MKTLALTYILLLLGTCSYSQKADLWTVFWDEKEEKFGFQDHNENTVIQPKFSRFSYVNRLDQIFIASEDNEDKFDIYYLTKSGKQFGRDSIFSFDNTPDCESEGFIRFRDNKTDQVGMFNRNGEVVIPAIYNYLSQVNNGLVMVLKDAEKKFWNEHKHSGCNHFSWTGGKTMLIDTANRVIIEKFTDNLSLDLYSYQQNDILGDSSNRAYFAGVDGKFHSFIDYQKDFSIWLKRSLLKAFTIENLRSVSSDNLTIWNNDIGWVSESAKKILENNFRLIKDRLSVIQKPGQDYFVSMNGLNAGIFEGEQYQTYFNNCGQALTDKYPVMTIVITHKKSKDSNQDHFDFLKTNNGYKLISLTIRNGKIKK